MLIFDRKKKLDQQFSKKGITGILEESIVDYVCDTHNVTSFGSRYTQGKTPLEIITGKHQNIFEYLDFGLYNWVTF